MKQVFFFQMIFIEFCQLDSRSYIDFPTGSLSKPLDGLSLSRQYDPLYWPATFTCGGFDPLVNVFVLFVQQSLFLVDPSIFNHVLHDRPSLRSSGLLRTGHSRRSTSFLG